jgi:hypothetical protein
LFVRRLARHTQFRNAGLRDDGSFHCRYLTRDCVPPLRGDPFHPRLSMRLDPWTQLRTVSRLSCRLTSFRQQRLCLPPDGRATATVYERASEFFGGGTRLKTSRWAKSLCAQRAIGRRI